MKTKTISLKLISQDFTAPTPSKAFIESIEKYGLINPITLQKLPLNNQYFIVAGKRRFQAIKQLGWKSVEATIYEGNVPTDITIQENLHRADNPREEFRILREMSNAKSMTFEQIQQVLGYEKTKLTKRLKLLKLIKPFQEAFILKQITLSVGYSLAKESEGFQHSAYAVFCSNEKKMSSKDIKALKQVDIQESIDGLDDELFEQKQKNDLVLAKFKLKEAYDLLKDCNVDEEMLSVLNELNARLRS